MEIFINPGKSGNILATIAIGGNYYQTWKKYAFHTWERYCIRHDLGLVVFKEDLISKKDPMWKKPTWQKTLIGRELKKLDFDVNNVCYLDSDILINYTAPNVFDFHKENSISLVSQKFNLPYPIDLLLRKIAFYRHYLYDKDYPLDSALFMTLKQIYEYHDLPVQKDYACAGFFIFNLEEHSGIMETWFKKYDRNIQTITGGGDEVHFNFECQNLGKVSWLDYKFQAMWIYEMAWKFPFLYDHGRYDNELINQCVESSLFTNYFLHFAGSWYESDMWKVGKTLESIETQKKLEQFHAYMQIPVTGEPKGQIKPKSISEKIEKK